MAALDLFGLEGKKALVIGGGQGMGESSARLLAAAGCDVAIVDVEADRAERVAAVVRGLGRNSAAILQHVGDDGSALAAQFAHNLGDTLGTVVLDIDDGDVAAGLGQ